MDKRSLLALLLIAIVIVGGSLLTPRNPVAVTDTIPIDTTLRADSAIATAPAAVAATDTASRRPSITPAAPTTAVQPTLAETTVVAGKGRQMQFISPGAGLSRVALTDYPDLKRRDGTLTLAPNAGELLRYRLATGTDTVRLDQMSFTRRESPSGVEFTSANPEVRISYVVDSVNYITHVVVSAPGVGADARLLVDLAPDLASGEADEKEDLRNLAYGYRMALADVQSVNLEKLDSTQYQLVGGPLEWVAIRNKYFVVAVVATDSARQFSSFVMGGGRRQFENRPVGIATASMPLTGGTTQFDLYTGPQSWQVLREVGHELSNVNPYAGWAWLRPMVEPFATIVMRMLLGLKALVGLSYGWVLVIFGVGIRLALWPLNQTAMRTSIRMQAIQPELAAVQKRYAKDPEGQRTAMMKLYAEHGMSPFSPLMGCLPMLIPMPILFALYFVFQNTIEFRGVPFLWLPDISLKDPYYITPILMGASMLVLSWIGMRVAPPNPQMKLMGYMMPAMFTIMFINFASGLNMYYAVQNLVAIPQQWLLTRERMKAAPGGVVAVKGSPAVKQRK